MALNSHVVVDDGGGGSGSYTAIGYVLDNAYNKCGTVINGSGGTEYIDVQTDGGYVKYTQYSIKWYGSQGLAGYPPPLMVRIDSQAVSRSGKVFKGWTAVSGGTLSPTSDGNNNANSYVISSWPGGQRLTIKPVWENSVTPTPTAPTKPANFRSNNTTQRWILYKESINFTWTASGGATNYVLVVDGVEKAWLGNVTSYTLSSFGKDAIREGAHTVQVKARNSHGDSPLSDYVYVYVMGEVQLKDGMNTGTMYNYNDSWFFTFNPSSRSYTKSGYTFAGWYTEANGGTRITNTFNLKDYGTRVLYAHWQGSNNYTVIFNKPTGVTNTPNNISHTGSFLIPSSPVPQKSGFAFRSYNENADGSGAAYYAGSSYNLSRNVTLYPIFTSNKTVTYTDKDKTSGSAPAAQSATYNTPITISGNTGGLTRTGYKSLASWIQSGGTTVYNFGTVYNQGNSLTLDPNWEPNKTVITYEGNTTDEATYDASYTFKPAISREGYQFRGWNLKDEAYQAGQTITWKITDSAVTIKAIWRKITSWHGMIPWIYVDDE